MNTGQDLENNQPSFSILVYNHMGLHKLKEKRMKKLFPTLIIMLIMAFVLAACGEKQVVKDVNDSEQATGNKENEKDKEKAIEVDKDLLSVEVTLPASMFEGQEIEVVIEEAKADGIKEVIKNSDGSLTYKMSKSKHAEMMKEMKNQLNSTIEDIGDTSYIGHCMLKYLINSIVISKTLGFFLFKIR